MKTIEEVAAWFKTHASNKDDITLAMKFPSDAAVDQAQKDAECTFPPQFRSYLTQLSPYTYGTHEPVQLVGSLYHNSFINVFEEGQDDNVPATHIPICKSNGSYFCVDTRNGQVQVWDHGGFTDEKWASIVDWIVKVWIGEV